MHAREVFHKAEWRRFGVVLCVCTAFAAAAACAPDDRASTNMADGAPATNTTPPLTTLPPSGHAWVIFGSDTVVAEVARTAEERAQGLMYREDVPEGTGMLFVFPDSQVRSFWMANTYVPLDIAYMDPSFRIVDIVAMDPLVTDSYPSAAPAMYGLEVPQGWFAEQHVAVGAQAEIVFGAGGMRH